MIGATKENNAFFRQLLFLGALITIGLIIFWELHFFVGSVLGAITLYVVLRGLLFWMTEKHRWKAWAASGVLVLMTSILLLGIGYIVFKLITSEIPNIDTSMVMGEVNKLPDRINDFLGFKVITGKVMDQVTSFLGGFITSLVNTTYSFAANVFMMIVILYFMLAHARPMERKLFAYMPFRGQSQTLIRHEVKSVIYSNAVGIPIIMLAQGAVASLVYWLLGMNDVFFWGFVTALCGLIPMIGTVIVSLPLGIYLISSGGVWQGITLIFCGLFIIANVDNLCRIILMKQVTDTHPLIVIFGVIMGIPLFGFWGIIFGPLLISGFLLLIKIYYREYKLIKPVPPPKPEEPEE